MRSSLTMWVERDGPHPRTVMDAVSAARPWPALTWMDDWYDDERAVFRCDAEAAFGVPDPGAGFSAMLAGMGRLATRTRMEGPVSSEGGGWSVAFHLGAEETVLPGVSAAEVGAECVAPRTGGVPPDGVDVPGTVVCWFRGGSGDADLAALGARLELDLTWDEPILDTARGLVRRNGNFTRSVASHRAALDLATSFAGVAHHATVFGPRATRGGSALVLRADPARVTWPGLDAVRLTAVVPAVPTP